jgi:hypothetical protein
MNQWLHLPKDNTISTIIIGSIILESLEIATALVLSIAMQKRVYYQTCALLNAKLAEIFRLIPYIIPTKSL